MGRKDVLRGKKFFDEVSMASPAQTQWIDVHQIDQGFVTISWIGTGCLGSIFVQGATLEDKSDLQDVDVGGTVAVAADFGTHQIQFNTFPGNYIRFRYVNSAGSGTLTISLCGKQVGG